MTGEYVSLQTFFFLWFALSGWLFRILIFATWVLPFAGPLLIGAVANNLVIKVTYKSSFFLISRIRALLFFLVTLNGNSYSSLRPLNIRLHNVDFILAKSS